MLISKLPQKSQILIMFTKETSLQNLLPFDLEVMDILMYED